MTCLHRSCMVLATSLVLLLTFSTGAGAQVMGHDDEQLVSVADQHAMVERMIEVLLHRYVFPETAAKIAAALRSDVAAGEYDRPLAEDGLAHRLSERIRSLSGDGHLWVMPQVEPDGAASRGGVTAEDPEDRRRRLARSNFGLPAAEVLSGNIGYLDIRQFVDPALSGDALAAAMAFLGNVDGLILDVRESSGGSPHMVALIASYLFEEGPVRLFDLYLRPADRTDQFWTASWLPSPRLASQPVFVLTAASTFSAGEGLAYVLQALDRAEVVGETTAGGANPGGFHRLNPRFVMFVAEGRVTSPATGSNWEGTGVRPDVEVDASRARDAAHRLLLERTPGIDNDPRPTGCSAAAAASQLEPPAPPVGEGDRT